MEGREQCVLVLGAGINGAAVARELMLNDVPVCVIDTADIACGATAASSRLIHGGLRYLEYGEFDLVRQSLDERDRWLQLAPQFVRPLRLYIPLATRLGGIRQAARKFFARRSSAKQSPLRRGMWLVRAGLLMYDLFSGRTKLPRRGVHRVGQVDVPRVDASVFRWLCSYSDAQVAFPERLTLALLDDARALAAAKRIWFRVLPYHRATMRGTTVEIRPVDGEGNALPVSSIEPAAIVNATGAWIDATLERLPISATRLIGGTKGSHFFTHHQALRECLGGAGIYVEAEDGRPIFMLPWLGGTLVGTTDLPFEGNPHDAVASVDELNYLLAAVDDVFPQLELKLDDVDMHYSGVRPLPLEIGKSPSAVSRHHQIVEHEDSPVPIVSLVGGKLTTARALAQETVAIVLSRIRRKPTFDSRNRVVPGGENYPDETQLADQQQEVAAASGFSIEQVRAVWALCGSRAAETLSANTPDRRGDDSENLAGTSLPLVFVRHVIRNEWITRLGDLVERRLMLLYEAKLSLRTLRHLAQLMVEENLLPSQDAAAEVAACEKRLQSQFGRTFDG